jgi:hypothetical protein
MNLNIIGGGIAVVALVAIFYYGHPGDKPVTETPAPTTTTTPPPGTPPPTTTYHRVTQGGGKGDPIECKSVRPYTEGKTQEELAAIAKQLGVTQADLAKYFVCVQ